MSDERKRKYLLLAIIALLVAFLAFMVAQIALDTADINNVFEIVVNNTDIGYGGMLVGTNERQPNVTYWANDTPIDIYLIAHVVGTGGRETLEFNASINGTVVQETTRDRTITNNLHEHFPMQIHVPKGANYSVKNNTNVFNMEWREYKILSGKNGTLSVNQTINNTLNGSGVFVPYTGATADVNLDTHNLTVGVINISSASTNPTIETRTATGLGLGINQLRKLFFKTSAGGLTTDIVIDPNSSLYLKQITSDPNYFNMGAMFQNTTTGNIELANGNAWVSIPNQTYTDAGDNIKLNLSGGTMTGALHLQDNNSIMLYINGTNTSTDISTLDTGTAPNNSVRFAINPRPVNNTVVSEVYLFRNTNTTGLTRLVIGKADNTGSIQSQIAANSDSFLNALTGNVSIGTNTVDKGKLIVNGNITELSSGSGLILKSPDGTKCGFLNWTNANTFASTAITCP